VVVENKKDVVNVHDWFLLCAHVELVSFSQFAVDILHNVSASFTPLYKGPYIIDFLSRRVWPFPSGVPLEKLPPMLEFLANADSLP